MTEPSELERLREELEGERRARIAAENVQVRAAGEIVALTKEIETLKAGLRKADERMRRLHAASPGHYTNQAKVEAWSLEHDALLNKGA